MLKDQTQAEYLEKKLEENVFSFIDVAIYDSGELVRRAHVLTKQAKAMEFVDDIAPLAMQYGKYVASQKASGEGAKKFRDWYFDISI